MVQRRLRSRYGSCGPTEAAVCSGSPQKAPAGLCQAPTLTGVTGSPRVRRQHRVLPGVIRPRGGEGIKAFSWPAREKDSAGGAQKDMPVLRTEAAMTPAPGSPSSTSGWGKHGGSWGVLGARVPAGSPGSPPVSPSLTLGWAETGAISGWAALAWWPPPRLGKPRGGCPSPSPLSWPTIGCPGDAGLDPHHWPSPRLSKQRGKQPQPAPTTAGMRPGTRHHTVPRALGPPPPSRTVSTALPRAAGGLNGTGSHSWERALGLQGLSREEGAGVSVSTHRAGGGAAPRQPAQRGKC